MSGVAWETTHSVDSCASLPFAWAYMTNVANWDDPPVTFELDGPFTVGTPGTNARIVDLAGVGGVGGAAEGDQSVTEQRPETTRAQPDDGFCLPVPFPPLFPELLARDSAPRPRGWHSCTRRRQARPRIARSWAGLWGIDSYPLDKSRCTNGKPGAVFKNGSG